MVIAKYALLLFFIPISTMAMSDKQLMTEARLKFADGNLKKAIQIYTQISPQSDFWLESIEERAWCWTRLNEYENALADLQSITSPVWSAQVGPETYMLSSFVSLKLCNYKEVLKKINLFKKRMLIRISALEKNDKNPLSKEFLSLIKNIKQSQLNLSQLGQKAELFPRYFFRDRALIQYLQVNDLSSVRIRLHQLAQNDLQEINNNLKKMKLIEVEMMQAVLTDSKSNAKSDNIEFSKVDSNKKLTFPITDDEVWLDEVGQFQVRANKCEKLQKKVL